MKTCPFCAEPIQDAAVKCRYCGSSLTSSALSREWYRSREGKKIAGVCAGLAQELGIAAIPVRLAFVLLTLIAGGAGLILYVILWVVMPYRPERVALPARDLEAIDWKRNGRPDAPAPQTANEHRASSPHLTDRTGRRGDLVVLGAEGLGSC